MPLPPELAEILSGHGIPIAVAVGRPDVLRQCVQHLDVLRGRFQQLLVVLHRGGDEGVIPSALDALILPCDKQPFHPLMPDAAGVTGQIEVLRNLVDATERRAHGAELILGEVGGLVHENPVVFLALVLRDSRCALQVAELHGGTVGKEQHSHGAVVGGNQVAAGPPVHRSGVNQFVHGLDDSLLQLRVGTPQNQNLDARILQGPPDAGPDQHVGLAAAPRAAIGRVPGLALYELPLLGIQLPQLQLDFPRGLIRFPPCHNLPPDKRKEANRRVFLGSWPLGLFQYHRMGCLALGAVGSHPAPVGTLLQRPDLGPGHRTQYPSALNHSSLF